MDGLELVVKQPFDGKRCIDVLLDKTAEEVDRMAAAESLMYFQDSRACGALWQVVSDPTEEDELREEAAGSLGTLWMELGIDYDRLSLIPERFLREALHDILMRPDAIDWDQLDNRTASFIREERT
ncbi:MAG: hypothetical protein RIT81_14580 [Deltaproteobacteria bacterium]